MRKHLILTLCGCSLLAWAGTRSWGDEEGRPAVGLAGLLPAYAPDGLSDDDFESLVEAMDPNWKEWTRETGTFVKDFYEGGHETIEAQQAALQRLRVKLRTIDKAMADPRYRSIHSKLAGLSGRLQPRVDLAEAMLETLTLDPGQARQERIAPAFASLRKSASALNTDLRGFKGGDRWKTWLNTDALAKLQPEDADAASLVDSAKAKLEGREAYADEVKSFVSRAPFLDLESALSGVQMATRPAGDDAAAVLRTGLTDLLDAVDKYRKEPSAEAEAAIRSQVDALRSTAPDGGARIAKVLGANFLNYNLRLVVSEGLFNRFYSETRRESSTVRDRVMEASVYGCQTSDVTTSLDLLPSQDNARFAIMLNGLVRTNTNGYTHQATVHTVGRHTFFAQKQITFDGHVFSGEPAVVSVRANNQTVDATTKFSWIPLFGRIADNVALREANARGPQANSIAAGRVTQQVSQELDRETREQFDNAAKDLETKTYGPLRKYDLYPDAMKLSSTDSQMRIWARVMGGRELGGSQTTPIASVPSQGLVAQIHETLLTNGMDRMGLNGKTLSDEEVKKLLEDNFSDILGREVKFEADEKKVEDREQQANFLMFDAHDPVRFTVENGVITLFIRAGLKRSNGEEIPTQVISVPFTPTIQGDEILLTRGNVGVRPVSRPPSVAAQVARANVMRQKIQSSLPERTLDGVFKVTQNDREVRLRASALQAEGGWLTVTLQ